REDDLTCCALRLDGRHGVVPVVVGLGHPACTPVVGAGADLDLLGPDEYEHPLRVVESMPTLEEFQRAERREGRASTHGPFEHVRIPDEPGHGWVHGRVVDLIRRPAL